MSPSPITTPTTKYHPLLSPISSSPRSRSPFQQQSSSPSPSPPPYYHQHHPTAFSTAAIDVELEPFGGGEERPAAPSALLTRRQYRYSPVHRFCRVFALVAVWGSIAVLAVALILYTSYRAMMVLRGEGGGRGGGPGVHGGGGGPGGAYEGGHRGGGHWHGGGSWFALGGARG